MSRAVVVLGMHRSGTSVITRGLKTLGVYLGDNLLGPAWDNPMGFWEDRAIMHLNEKLLEALGLQWHNVSILGNVWQTPRVNALAREAARLLKRNFLRRPLWGFKDPRTARLLPFWLRVFDDLGVEDSYVVALRRPHDVAKSLYERQKMPAEKAHRLTLVHTAPFLHLIASKPIVVVDYDRLIADPRAQLRRVRARLKLPNVDGRSADTIESFARQFVRPEMRHSKHKPILSRGGPAGDLTARGYMQLYKLATDRMPLREFWPAWRRYAAEVRRLIEPKDGTVTDTGSPRNPLLEIYP